MRKKAENNFLFFSGGEPERPLVVHVGRLGAEKSLDFLKKLVPLLPMFSSSLTSSKKRGRFWCSPG